jgi:hypothetical protein
MTRVFALGGVAACLYLAGPFTTTGHALADDKLVYADFETEADGRPVSSRGGPIQLTSYQENTVGKSRFKGKEGTDPPSPSLVRTSKEDQNRAIAFEYELFAPNQWAGVSVEIQGQAAQDGKPVADDVSGYKNLVVQVYATELQPVRIEFISRGMGIDMPPDTPYPQFTFKAKQGFATYKVPLGSIVQPSWVEVRVSPKDVLKKLTAVTITAYCDQCRPVKGTLLVDNLVFEK